jgi:hypothetical protein
MKKFECNIKYLYLYFLFAFSGAFLANITIFSPIYFSFIGGMLLLVVYFSFRGKVSCDIEATIVIFIDILVVVYYFIQMILTNSFVHLKDYTIHAFSILYLIFIIIFSRIISRDELINIIKKYMVISNIFLLLDIVWRFYRRDMAYTGIFAFYNYKFNGIMFMDSNFSGFFALINFSFLLYLRDYKIIFFSRKRIFFQFLLIVFNLSRAAIIASLILCFYLLFKKQKIAMKIFIMFVFVVFINIFLVLIISDPSFQTKIDIFTKTIEYLRNASVRQLVFGNGLTSSIIFLGRSAHNYISLLIIEMGFVALLLILLLFFCIYFSTRKVFIYILIPYLSAGLSMAPGVIPYFYAIAGMMHIFQKNGYRIGNYEKTK